MTKTISDPVARVLEKLEDLGRIYRAGDGYQAHCPAHEDRLASLSVGTGKDGRALLHCFAGCETPDIVAALGLEMNDLRGSTWLPMLEKWSDLPHASSHRSLRRAMKSEVGKVVAIYPYYDFDGTLLYEVIRYEPKGFSQRRPDGAGGWIYSVRDMKRTIYKMPELQSSYCSTTVFVVEGEKDADRLWSEGFTATTSSGGAGQWPDDPAINALFAGKVVHIIPDSDWAGETHAHDVLVNVYPYAATVDIVRVPVGYKDISAYLDMGGKVETVLGGLGGISVG